jgi:hypothetical protein
MDPVPSYRLIANFMSVSTPIEKHYKKADRSQSRK